MILKELFDAPLPFLLTSDDTGYFNVNGKTYDVYFDPVEDEQNAVEMSFCLRTGVNKLGRLTYSTDIAGSGDEVAVFSTVIAIARKFVARSPKLTKFVFCSKTNEPSRIKLYDRMVPRFLTGWTVTSSTRGGEKVYTFERNAQQPTQPGQEMDDVQF